MLRKVRGGRLRPGQGCVRFRRPRLPFLGAPALRLFFATLDPRRQSLTQRLFSRLRAGGAVGYGWVPRLWWKRGARIFRRSLSQTLRVARGRRGRRLLVQRWNVGLVWGHFARTQRLAIFKKRASAKKRRNKLATTRVPVIDFRVQRLKELRAGLRRQTTVTYEPKVEAQLRGVFA